MSSEELIMEKLRNIEAEITEIKTLVKHIPVHYERMKNLKDGQSRLWWVIGVIVLAYIPLLYKAFA